ncbi:hypothetical protein EVAR_34002_1 [Eumeta japonica]|uniref:Uncharacterized protein n=1 Tax=Eumeta variegata TaxID=151549 RepID=A0A4C1VSS3_EUMVA|nr:hypothetical protein EVAR_34002_1 [Eumeta japonica]
MINQAWFTNVRAPVLAQVGGMVGPPYNPCRVIYVGKGTTRVVRASGRRALTLLVRNAGTGGRRCVFNFVEAIPVGCGWESLMKSVTLGNVTMSHRTRERLQCLASLSHSTMIGLLRAQH